MIMIFHIVVLKLQSLDKFKVLKKMKIITEEIKNNIAASFQKAAVKAITNRVKTALNEFEIRSISLVGGVAANELLRNEFISIGKEI